MKNLTLLAIDDDELILQSLRIGLPKHWRLEAIHGLSELPSKGDFTAAFVDMHLTGNTNRAEGIDVIKKLKETFPNLEIVAMSGDLDRDLMEKCLRAGASRYIAKPLNLDEVIITLDKIEALRLLQAAPFRHPDMNITWVGSSPEALHVTRQIAMLKGEDGPILIEGETGTGKEVAAQLIHSQEPDRPLIAVNVAAIPENLFESELFGHVRGAFTGADYTKVGLAEAASGGDLFLDEIEALSLTLQAKLLRFLETGEVRRIGAKESIRIKTRVIAATNKSLEQMVKEGTFREDLLWRLCSKKIKLPPLRERKDDIAELCHWFLAKEKNRKKELSADAVKVMQDYSWPGNVRELKRICEQLAVTSPLPIIRGEDVLHIIKPTLDAGSVAAIDFSLGLEAIVSNYEAIVLTQALNKLNDVDEVARTLQVSRSNLYKKIKDYNIEWSKQ
ncbi:MAG: sigma-54-dependent Fis family transcriptional regulator [Bdellovibrionales bacterium]|nr:sigma-54-dependent Fis family transcriptional regulator [Bdellovibrionales bacterium]